MDQRTPEWYAARCGKVTASRVADVIATTRSGYAASRANYMAELVVERLTGQVAEGFTNAAMQWGIDQEPAARKAYSARVGELVEEVGFIPHPSLEAGASPDGLVGADGLVELKCPNTATHIEYLMEKTVPTKYFTQVQWQLVCTKRKWADFVSFDPRMPPNLALFVVRVQRDDEYILKLEREVATFLGELESKVNTLKEMKL